MGVGFTVENVSATSIETRSGERFGCLTALLDIAKAFVPVLALELAFPDDGYEVICAAAVTLGHVYPVFHRFKGGRGTSTLLGGLLVMDPLSIPVTIAAGYLIGLLAFKDLLLAHLAGWCCFPSGSRRSDVGTWRPMHWWSTSSAGALRYPSCGCTGSSARRGDSKPESFTTPSSRPTSGTSTGICGAGGWSAIRTCERRGARLLAKHLPGPPLGHTLATMSPDRFTHTVVVASTLERAWAVLQEPETWGEIAGVQEVYDATHHPDGTLHGYRFVAEAGRRLYEGRAETVEADAPSLMVVVVDTPEVEGTITTELRDSNPHGIEMTVSLKLRARGILASVFFPVVVRAVGSGFAGQVEAIALRMERRGPTGP